MLYRYIGECEFIYPEIVIPGSGTLVGVPHSEPVDFGDIEPPGDNRWIPVEPPAPKPSKATASKES